MTRQNLTIAAVAALALGFSPVVGGAAKQTPASSSSGSAQPRGGGESSRLVVIGIVELVRFGIERLVGPPARGAGARPTRRRARRRGPTGTRAPSQRSGGGTSSGRAVPRGSSGAAGSTRGSGTSSSAGSNDNSGGNREAVPAYSRPRDGRNATGTAVERRGRLPGSGGGGGVYYPGVIYDPYYYGYGYYDPYYSTAVFELLEPVRLRLWPRILRLRSVHVRIPVRLSRSVWIQLWERGLWQRELQHPAVRRRNRFDSPQGEAEQRAGLHRRVLRRRWSTASTAPSSASASRPGRTRSKSAPKDTRRRSST